MNHPQAITPSALMDSQSIAVLGAGLSGRAAARLGLAKGKSVVLLDDRDRGEIEEVQALVANGAEVRWGDFGELPQGCDALIVSPGVPPTHRVVLEAESRGVAIAPEIELAWAYASHSKTVAITGTNGKTTVTMLAEEILSGQGERAVRTGNIGHAFCDAVIEAEEVSPEAPRRTVFCAEVSSFQLERINFFAPDVAVLLNITPDHLDRHGSLAQYTAAKARITEFQDETQTLIVNQDDPECLRIGRASRAQVLLFSTKRAVEHGAWLDDDRLVLSRPGAKPRRLLDLDELALHGMHNVENCLAAACVGMALGLERKKMAETIRGFGGAPHRLQFAGSSQGVDFFNDSKATNLDAMMKALESFAAPIHLIAGGRDKDSPFRSVAGRVGERVQRAYLIGEAAGQIEQAWGEKVSIAQCETLDRALAEAVAEAESGDVILLSPGCASFDQFSSYADRGEAFVRWVETHCSAQAEIVEGKEVGP